MSSSSKTLSEEILSMERLSQFQENFETLKKLAHKAVADYDDLQRKYDANQKQYLELTKQLTETQDKLEKLQDLVEPAYEEFTEVQTRYELEKTCRTKAESLAAEMHTQNTKLKRESTMLMTKLQAVDNSIEHIKEVIETEEELYDEVKTYEDRYNQIIDDLHTEIAGLKLQLEKSRKAELEIKAQNTVLQSHIGRERDRANQTNNTLEQYQRMSVCAVTEFEKLKHKYNEKCNLQVKAEEIASKAKAESVAIRTQSSVAIGSVVHDKKLIQAFDDIEKLNKDLATQKLEYEAKIKQLTDELESCQNYDDVSDLQQRFDTATDQVDSLTKQIKDTNKWNEKLQKEVSDLEKQIIDLKNPPPPPPPPLPTEGKFKFLINALSPKITKKASKLGAVKEENDKTEKFSKALEEMMSRINKVGNSRGRSVNQSDSLPEQPTTPKSPTPTVMGNLSALLSRSASVDITNSRAAPVGENNNEPEFMSHFRKFKEASERREKKLAPVREDSTEA